MTTTTRDEQQEMQDGATRLADALDKLAAIAAYDFDFDDPEERAAMLDVLDDHGHGLNVETDEDGELSIDADTMREAAIEALDEFGLDFYVQGERRGGEWTVTGWVLVIGTGGPHYELRSDGYVHGWGWFGANKVRADVNIAVTDYFEQLAEI